MTKRTQATTIVGSCLVATLALWALSDDAQAHCQVPCGIYDDHARVDQIREDIVTITKAVNEMAALAAKQDAQSKQQFVRWVMNKETHADRVIRTIADYFFAQKIKMPAAGDKKATSAYYEMLARHHAVLVAAMLCKQGSSMEPVNALTKAVDAIAGYWPVKTSAKK